MVPETDANRRSILLLATAPRKKSRRGRSTLGKTLDDPVDFGELILSDLSIEKSVVR